MATLPKEGIDNSNLKQEFPRTSENEPSSVQKLNDLDVDVEYIRLSSVYSIRTNSACSTASSQFKVLHLLMSGLGP
jgi:hypothetical protein